MRCGFVWVVCCALGCAGGAKKHDTTTGGGGTSTETSTDTSSQDSGAQDTTEGAPACEKGRCLADISKVVQERRPAARACYDAGVKRKPGIEGKVIINFTIEP